MHDEMDYSFGDRAGDDEEDDYYGGDDYGEEDYEEDDYEEMEKEVDRLDYYLCWHVKGECCSAPSSSVEDLDGPFDFVSWITTVVTENG